MTDNYTPIYSLDATPATLEDFKAIDKCDYDIFVIDYAQNVLTFLALADQIADSQFSDSSVPAHLRVVVPSLNIDLHFPLTLKLETVANTITSSIMAAKTWAATARLESAIELAVAKLVQDQQAAKDAIDAANDAAAAEARSVAEAAEATMAEAFMADPVDSTPAV